MGQPSGIEGLTGRVPLGAAVTVGIKKDGSAGGFPVEKDYFHIVQAREEAGIRPHHPAFAKFHTQPADVRKMLRGNLVHAAQRDCFEFYLRAQQLPRHPSPPNKRPACQGDGKTAERFVGPGPQDFRTIACPHQACEFRQRNERGVVPCKPFARLLFRLRWPDGNQLPTPLVKYTTGAWSTTANLLGFFEYIEQTARQLGMEHWSLFGYPFMLTVTRGTNAAARTAFPVVVISPEKDPVEFFAHQRELIREIGAPLPYLALTDAAEQDPAVIAADYRSVSIGS